jgi:dTMP kinase
MKRESGAIYWALEGIGGSGKSTQQKMLTNYLTGIGRDVVYIREPGGVKVAEEIRELIFTLKENECLLPDQEVMMFMLARYFLAKQVVSPMLDKGTDVVTDRSVVSTGAYQGFGERADFENIEKIARIVLGSCLPDVMILLDLPWEQGMERRSQELTNDPYDNKTNWRYWHRLVTGYREMANNRWLDLNWKVVDARKSIDEVSVDIKLIVDQVLGI